MHIPMQVSIYSKIDFSQVIKCTIFEVFKITIGAALEIMEPKIISSSRLVIKVF